MTDFKPYLKTERIISLPIAVETNALLISWREELFILINALATRETLVYKLNTFEFGKLTSLPLLATSAVTCKDQMVVSGSDETGNLILAAIDFNGKILKKISPDITPSVWPILGCSEKIYLAWQQQSIEIQRGSFSLGSMKIQQLPPIRIATTSVKLEATSQSIYAVISKKDQTTILDLITSETYALPRLQTVSIGHTEEGLFFGWIDRDQVYLKFQHSEEKHCFSLENPNSGKLNAISGRKATVWFQYREMNLDGDYQWKSAIIQKDTAIFKIENFIHTIGAWQDMLVAVQDKKIILLKNNPSNK